MKCLTPPWGTELEQELGQPAFFPLLQRGPSSCHLSRDLIVSNSSRQEFWKAVEIQAFSSWMKRVVQAVRAESWQKHCCWCCYFSSKIINIVVSLDFCFCKQRACAGRNKRKDSNCLWCGRGNYFKPASVLNFFTCPQPICVCSKPPRPLPCVYLTLHLHKAAQLEKDVPYLYFHIFGNQRDLNVSFIWPFHAGGTWTVTVMNL